MERALLGLPFGPDGMLLTILLATFLLGFFLDWIEITLIVLPLVAPVVTAWASIRSGSRCSSPSVCRRRS